MKKVIISVVMLMLVMGCGSAPSEEVMGSVDKDARNFILKDTHHYIMTYDEHDPRGEEKAPGMKVFLDSYNGSDREELAKLIAAVGENDLDKVIELYNELSDDEFTH